MFASHKKSNTITLVVEGMRCTQCEATIKIALQKVPGVKRVSIQKRRNVIVEVQADQTDLTPALKKAIEQTGYQVVEMGE